MEELFLLRRTPIFSSLSFKEIQRIFSRLTVRNFSKGEVLCQEGCQGDQTLSIVASGQLQVTLGEKTVSNLLPTNYFGEVSLFSGEVHSATIKALTDGQLFVVDKPLFEETIANHPEIVRWLSETLGKKLHHTNQITLQQQQRSRIYGIFSRESGTGKSVLAVNLAASIFQQTGKKVLVIDMVFSGGSAASLLGVQLPRALFDGAASLADLPSFIVHHPCGVDLLVLQTDGSRQPITDFSPLFQLLRDKYELVFVDLPTEVKPNELAECLKQVDKAVFLMRDNLCSESKLFEHLQLLKQYLPDIREKLTIGAFLGAKNVRPRCAIDYGIMIPFDRELEFDPQVPDVIKRPKSSLAKAVARLAREICNIRIGIALSAGMASGMAHLGVLKVLERENIPVDMITGTSGGALFGAAFAAGYRVENVEKVIFGLSRFKLLTIVDFTFPYAGFIRGKSVMKFIRSFLGDLRFEDLKVPMKIIATDLHTGEVFIFERGEMLTALRASISVPGIFTPLKLHGQYLVDGATISPLPVDTLYRYGIDKVIAVNICSHPDNEKDQKRRTGHFFDVITHSRAITSHHLAEVESHKANLTITPDISKFKWRDYHRGREIVACGERAAEEALPLLRNLISA